jgi:hypothetical protein
MRTASLAIVLALSASCAEPASLTPVPPPPNSADGTGLTIRGPSRIAPGATGQYTAALQLVNGSTADVTPFVVWSALQSSIVEFRGRGAALGRSRGETAVRATYGRHTSAALDVMVLEEGTFKLWGVVIDTGHPVFGGALIAARDENGAHLETTSDGDEGQYALYGVRGPVRVTISHPSYVTHTEDIVVREEARRDFILRPAAQ